MYHMFAGPLVKFSVLTTITLAATGLWTTASDASELLMFERDGCVWCQRWDREVGPIYDKTAEAKVLPLRRIDIDREKATGVILASPVRYTPTFVVVDNGREVGRITGYISDDVFWGLLGKLSDKLAPPLREPNRI